MNRMGLLIVATVLLGGCASSYVVDAGPEAEATYDGLVPVDSARLENFWAKPDVDYTSYTKILLLTPEFEFRMQGSDAKGRVGTEEFPLSDAYKQSLAETVRGLTQGRGADCVIEAVGKQELVQQAIELVRHGGRIQVFSRPGEGTRMRVFLPLKRST